MTPCQQALRAAHTRHRDQLVYTYEATRSGVVYRRWTVGADSLEITTLTGEPSARVKIYAGNDDWMGHTRNPQTVLDVLASFGLAPITLSSGYIAGAANGRGQLTFEPADVQP